MVVACLVALLFAEYVIVLCIVCVFWWVLMGVLVCHVCFGLDVWLLVLKVGWFEVWGFMWLFCGWWVLIYVGYSFWLILIVVLTCCLLLELECTLVY